MRLNLKLITACAAVALMAGTAIAQAPAAPGGGRGAGAPTAGAPAPGAPAGAGRGGAGAAGGGRGGGAPANIPDYNKIGPGGAIAPPAPPGGGAYPGYRPQSTENGQPKKTPEFEDVFNVLDAFPNLPANATVKPKKARKLLILVNPKGYAHSVIPLTSFVITELGKYTGAWTADTTYNISDINTANLNRYDGLVLNNTTGAFLDDTDAAGTAARRAALLAYVRSGHGLIMTHAAGDSYHGGGGSTWPEYSKMVGAWFKSHWYYPQPITVKIDDPKSPINAAFGGKPFTIHDEVYTFAQDSFSRKNVHVLTSLDYSKMSEEDKAREGTRRTDGDYALSYIKREGEGRIFYNVLGHSEHIYFIPHMLQALAAGIQYAVGDLKADDSPSAK